MPDSPREARFLALGDSYTIGESVAAGDRWPNELVRLLRAQGRHIADPVIIARTGWTTDQLSAAMDDARLAGVYDLVSLLIGVNNHYRNRPVAEFGIQFTALLQRAVRLAGGYAGHVIVVAIPDWGVTPFAAGRDRARIAAEIDSFNRVVRDDAARAGTRFVDIAPIARRAQHERDLIASDGLHPSAAMYREWAQLILPIAAGVV